MRASKIPRGFLARAFQNFGDKKASKTAIFENEKSEEKKTYVQRPILHTNTSAALLRKKVKQENKETWEKQGTKLRQGKPSSTDIFKRPRKRKSTEM